MGIKSVSELYGIPVKTLYRWVEQRIIPHTKLPTGRVMFEPCKVDQWFAKFRVEAETVPQERIAGGR